MNYGKVLAIAMIVLSVAASIAYLIQKDYRHAIYWGASATLIASVTF